MESRSERHRHAATHSVGRRAVGAAVVVLLAGGATYAFTQRGVNAEAPGAGTSAAGAKGPAPCSDATPLTINGLSKASAQALLAAVATEAGGDCAALRAATDGDSGRALTLGPPADADPSAAAAASGKATAEPTALATSPIVLAMPSEMAKALGSPAIDTKTLQSLLTEPTPWADRGRAAWGGFTIDSPDPSTSAIGAAAFANLAGVANGGPLTAALDYADPSPGEMAVIKLEHALVTDQRKDAALPALKSLKESVARASAYVTTEADLARYAAADPVVAMTGFPIAGGRAALAWSVGVPAKADKATTDAAAELNRALATTAGRAALAAAGLRPPGGPVPTAQAPGVVPASLPADATPLTTAERTTVAGQWTLMRTRISTLAVLDASGSMRDLMPGSTIPKIDVVRGLAVQSYKVASPKARSGIWAFHTNTTLEPVIDKLAPLQRNDTMVGSVPHSLAAAASLGANSVGGGTPLYQAVRDAYTYANAQYDPAYVNQILVLTDGRNEDSSSTVTAEALIAHLKKSFDPKKPVRIICIALNPDDLKTLEQIAAPTGGKAVSAGTMAEVPEAVRIGLFTS